MALTTVGLTEEIMTFKGLSTPLSPPSSETGSNGSSSPSSSPVKGTKPVLSYIALIAKAILNSPDCRLLLSDIYQYIMDNFPYYRNNDRSWRNSIRHNLSLNECFIKSGRSNDGRGHFWAVHPANVEDFMRGDYRRRRARLRVRATITAKAYETSYHPYSTPSQMYGNPSSSYVTMTGSPSSMVGLPYASSTYMAQNTLSAAYDMMSYAASSNSTMSTVAPSLIASSCPSSSPGGPSMIPSYCSAASSLMTSSNSTAASSLMTSSYSCPAISLMTPSSFSCASSSLMTPSYSGVTSSSMGGTFPSPYLTTTSAKQTTGSGAGVCLESITPPSSPENQALGQTTLLNDTAMTANYSNSNTFTTHSNVYNCNQMIPPTSSFVPPYYSAVV